MSVAYEKLIQLILLCQEPLRWSSVQHLPTTKGGQKLEVPVEDQEGDTDQEKEGSPRRWSDEGWRSKKREKERRVSLQAEVIGLRAAAVEREERIQQLERRLRQCSEGGEPN